MRRYPASSAAEIVVERLSVQRAKRLDANRIYIAHIHATHLRLSDVTILRKLQEASGAVAVSTRTLPIPKV